MAQATVLGSLLVQLGMDSAQFERASQKAQSTVSKMAANIGVSAKDVVAASNRMGVSVTAFAGQVAALQTRLNPGNQALANYRREMDLLRQALRIGAITQDQFRVSVQSSLTTYRAAGDGVKGASGSMQAGMQQLGFQINDVATQFASGTKPMQIFGQQAGQVVQSVALMTNGAGKFGAFLAGPWGIAITAGVIVLSSFLGKLGETEDALEKVQFASNAMADAQSILGNVMDLTTGKINTQNKALIALARAQLVVAQLNSQKRAQDAKATISDSNYQSVQSSTYLGAGTGGVSLYRDKFGRSPVAQIAEDFKSGRLNTDQAVQKLNTLQKAGQITADTFAKMASAYANLGVENANQTVYQQGLDALNGKGLGPLAKPAAKTSTPATGPRGKDQDKIDARYDDEMNRLTAERASLEADYTQTIEAKYQANVVAIDNDLASFTANTLANKDIGKARQQALILEATKNADLQKQIAENDRDDALANKASAIAQQDLQLQIDQVQLRGQLAVSTKDQRDAALELLALQDKLKIAELDRIMATEAAGSAAWDNARVEKDALQKSSSQRQTLVERQHMSPMEQYRFNLQSSVANINDAMENIQVGAMQNLTDGIAGAIAGTQKLGDVFKNVAQSIIADLIRIQIQKALVGGLSNALGSVGGLFGGSALSSASIAGAGSYDFSAVSIAGTRAAGGSVRAGLPYMTGELGRELFVPDRNGQIIPNHELSGLGAGGGGDTYYVGPGADEFWGKVDGIASNRSNQSINATKQRDTRRATRKLGKNR